MAKGKVRVRYDPEADIVYMLIKEGPIKDTVDVAEDVFIEFAEDESIAGIEVWRARENIFKPLADHIAMQAKIAKGAS